MKKQKNAHPKKTAPEKKISKEEKKRKRKGFIMIIALLLSGIFLLVLGINLHLCFSVRKDILTLEEGKNASFQADAILVLGAGVRDDGTPSMMLEDRLLTCLALYESGVCPKIIVSGDHGREDYDEVNTMKNYLVEKGVPSEAIFMDHAGFSTYDSLYRTKAVFGAKTLYIVTQEYHAYRAAYIGKRLGMDCRAVAAPILASNAASYARQPYYNLREVVARTKDYFCCLFKPQPKYLGEAISLEASGDVTNDG